MTHLRSTFPCLALLAASLLLAAGCAGPAPQASHPAVAAAPAAATAEIRVPDHFAVGLDLSTGPVTVVVDRADAPVGAERLYRLVEAKFFDGARFFRVVPGFVVQFGLAAEPALTKRWDLPLHDDPVRKTNARGTIVFAATSEPNSRTTQLFINLGPNGRLDRLGFAPVGRIVAGMDNVDRIYSGDGEGPDQDRIEKEGNAYLMREFPKLDFIRTARIVPVPPPPQATPTAATPMK